MHQAASLVRPPPTGVTVQSVIIKSISSMVILPDDADSYDVDAQALILCWFSDSTNGGTICPSD
jgi:hypothetical protein